MEHRTGIMFKWVSLNLIGEGKGETSLFGGHVEKEGSCGHSGVSLSEDRLKAVNKK